MDNLDHERLETRTSSFEEENTTSKKRGMLTVRKFSSCLNSTSITDESKNDESHS